MFNFFVAQVATIEVFDDSDNLDVWFYVGSSSNSETRPNGASVLEVSSRETLIHNHGSPRSRFCFRRPNIALFEVAAGDHLSSECFQEAWPHTHPQHSAIGDKAFIGLNRHSAVRPAAVQHAGVRHRATLNAWHVTQTAVRLRA